MPVSDKYLHDNFNGAFHDREHQKAFAAQSVAPMYATAAPNVMDRKPMTDVFLPRYMVLGMRSKYGKNYRYLPQYQEEGTCVGQSHSTVSTIVLGVSALLAGFKFPGRAAVAPIYAGSRVDIGKNPGTWQGSTGSWAAAWLTQYGVTLLEELGLNDNPANEKDWLKTLRADEQMGMKWTASRDGVPKDKEDIAKLRPINQAPMVTTVEEVRAALSNLTPVNLCGMLHPSQKCDSKGVSTSISSGGGHSTCLVGCFFDGSEWWYDFMNSWWFYYTGGFCRSANKIDQQFKGTVTRISERSLKGWLQERDCYAMVGVQGLEPVSKEFQMLMKN
jgi:hypothetical protein